MNKNNIKTIALDLDGTLLDGHNKIQPKTKNALMDLQKKTVFVWSLLQVDQLKEMLEYAKYSVAMGNAQEKVKKITDYVTVDNNDEGIYKALVHFDLIEDKY